MPSWCFMFCVKGNNNFDLNKPVPTVIVRRNIHVSRPALLFIKKYLGMKLDAKSDFFDHLKNTDKENKATLQLRFCQLFNISKNKSSIDK